MANDPQATQSVARTVVVDLVVAGIILLLGLLVAWDSTRLGASWGSDGPGPGYFPFYIGLLLCVSSLVIGAQACMKLARDRHVFVERGQLRQVLVILLPSTAYVLGVQLIGIYVSSAVFIVLFMRYVGRYSWARGLAVGVGVSATSFVLFEIWFTIPLPKGPLEALFGY